MICSRCGKSIPDASKFCNNCGLSFQQQNAVAPYTPPSPPPVQYQQPPVYQQPIVITQSIVTDGSSIGAFILGLLIPIFITFFFWLSWHDQQPLKTRSLLFGALTHFLIFNLPTILFFIIMKANYG